MDNVTVKSKGEKENANNLVRRFSKRVNGSGILRRVRSIRFDKRKPSRNMRNKQKVSALKKAKYVDRMIKLGKLPDRRRNRQTILED